MLGLVALSGQIAQLVEHTPEKRGVAGSNPALATIGLFAYLNCMRLRNLDADSPRT